MPSDAPQSDRFDAEQHDAPQQPEVKLLQLPAFRPQRLRYDRAIDQLLGWGAIIVLLGVLMVSSLWTADAGTPSLAIFVLVVIGVFMLNLLSVRTTQEMAEITALIEAVPDVAEHRLTLAMRRRPLQNHVRTTLYHRAALLRHRQQRFDEAAAICTALLAQPLGRAASLRGNLLLTLCHAQLEQQDLSGAYDSIAQLHQASLSLFEQLGLLSLQTRYEVTAGLYDTALQDVASKIERAELMPAPLCGAMHAMLATAAEHAGDEPLASWLSRRAELLLTPEQLDDARAGRNMDGFVIPPGNAAEKSE